MNRMPVKKSKLTLFEVPTGRSNKFRKKHSNAPDQSNCSLQIVSDRDTLSRVRELRKRKLRPVYPKMNFDTDPLDDQALVLYSINSDGEINSTARLSVDGKVPLPEESFLSEYRKQNKRLCEWGRFAIDRGDRALLKTYYRTIYLLASRMECDAIVMAMKPKDIDMHERLIGVRVIESDMNITYGGEHSLACVLWELNNTKSRFFNWAGGENDRKGN